MNNKTITEEIVEIDLNSFKVNCHLFPRPVTGFSVCGILQGEARSNHTGIWNGEIICPLCSNPICPKCRGLA